LSIPNAVGSTLIPFCGVAEGSIAPLPHATYPGFVLHFEDMRASFWSDDVGPSRESSAVPTTRLPKRVLDRLACEACEILRRECDEHVGIDDAFQAGREWAENEARRVTTYGLIPVGPWFGTLREAERQISGLPQSIRAELAALVNEVARERWSEVTGWVARHSRRDGTDPKR
jgi:hypothetical protein